MTIPRCILRRIRRAIHRQLMNLDHEQLVPLDCERQASPLNFARWILGLATLAVVIFFVAGCTTITTTAADGTVTTTRAPAPGVLPFAGEVLRAYSLRPIVRQEKSATPADLQRILRGRPITRQEIANRWQPANR